MMTVSSTGSVAEQATPSFVDWAALLANNVARRSHLDAAVGSGMLWRVRADVRQAAQAYTTELTRAAAAAGLDSPHHAPPQHAPSDGDQTIPPDHQPVVATGHQPIVFHPGLMAKNRLLQQLLNQQPAASGLMVLIDTDEGHAGHIRYPQATPQLQIATANIATSGPLYLSQTLLTEERVADIGQHIVLRLEEFGFADAAERTAVVMDQYTRLAGTSAVAANSIVRRLWEGQTSYLELPLSRLCGVPSVRQFLHARVSEAGEAAALHETYNRTLDEYRARHGIVNPANPFPNLMSTGRQQELPFWIIRTDADGQQRREPLMVDRQSSARGFPPEAIHASDALLVPRGMMISAVLRLLVSDLFIHGTGGQRYDVCTNEFFRNWKQVTLPDFVTATATRHLFADEVRQLEHVQQLRRHLHNSRHRFRRFVTAGQLSSACQVEAERLLQQRQRRIDAFNAAQAAGLSAREWHFQLKQIREQIHTFTHRVIAADADLRLPPHSEREVLTDRTLPFFFFD